MAHNQLTLFESQEGPYDSNGVYTGYIPPEEEVTPLQGDEKLKHHRFKGVLAALKAAEIARVVTDELPSDHGRENHQFPDIEEGVVSPIVRRTETLTSAQKNANARRAEAEHYRNHARNYRRRGQSS